MHNPATTTHKAPIAGSVYNTPSQMMNISQSMSDDSFIEPTLARLKEVSSG